MDSWGFVVGIKMAAADETKEAFVGETSV